MTPEFPELASCQICPQQCGANRFKSIGFCGADHRLRINLAQLHHGEEPVLSGSQGSGTIFFSHCNLRCVYCQNYPISQQGWGAYSTPEECSELMLRLQASGAHNVNLVSPTHYILQLIKSIQLAREKGLGVPVVWNSNAYESVETLQRLRGLVDIYLPDFKYAHAAYSLKYSSARDYPAVALAALKEMRFQAGDLEIGQDGIATKGLLVRHLVLPNRLSGTKKALYILHESFGPHLALSLMAQYYPAGRAAEYAELSRPLHHGEYADALETAAQLGFTRIFAQELSSQPEWTPAFSAQGLPLDQKPRHFRGKESHV